MIGKIVGKNYYLDGKRVTKAAFYRKMKTFALTGSGASLQGWKPLASDALAINPSQIAEAQTLDRRFGVPTEYVVDHDEKGEICGARPLFTSRAHRKAYMQAYGYYDRSGGYGDASPGGTKRDIPDPPNYAEWYE